MTRDGPTPKGSGTQQRRPVMLAVLDGWGWREETADNAVRQARTPAFDRLWGGHGLTWGDLEAVCAETERARAELSS